MGSFPYYDSRPDQAALQPTLALDARARLDITIDEHRPLCDVCSGTDGAPSEHRSWIDHGIRMDPDTIRSVFVVTTARPLAVGLAEFLRFRWTGDKSGKAMTGVLSCGELNGYYYVVHFVDELRAATRTFPAVRTSLKTLAPRRN